MFPKHSDSWQYFAREWHIIGQHERAEHCQFIADYWQWPLWKQLLWVFQMRQVMRELTDDAGLADLVSLLHRE
jgi:hypothetical protein